VNRAVALAQDEPVDGAWDDTVEVHRSRFAPDGFLEWYPVGRPAMTWRDAVRAVYRAMWIGHLTGGGDSRDALDKMLEHSTVPDTDTVSAWRATIDDMFSGLLQLARRGIGMTEELLAALRRKDWDRAKVLVSALVGLDEEIRVYGEIHNATKPLVIIARYERDNLEGADAKVLAETTLKIYRDCAARCEAMLKKAAEFGDACGAAGSEE
jgi:hypothetical protein